MFFFNRRFENSFFDIINHRFGITIDTDTNENCITIAKSLENKRRIEERMRRRVYLAFKCCTPPRHLNSPLTMITRPTSNEIRDHAIEEHFLLLRLHNVSHSSMECDVITTDLWSFRVNVNIQFQRNRLARTSIPVVGSWKKQVVEYEWFHRFSYIHEDNRRITNERNGRG